MLREHHLVHIDEIVVLPFHTFEVTSSFSPPLLLRRRVLWRPLLGVADLLLSDAVLLVDPAEDADGHHLRFELPVERGSALAKGQACLVLEGLR